MAYAYSRDDDSAAVRVAISLRTLFHGVTFMSALAIVTSARHRRDATELRAHPISTTARTRPGRVRTKCWTMLPPKD